MAHSGVLLAFVVVPFFEASRMFLKAIPLVNLRPFLLCLALTGPFRLSPVLAASVGCA